MSKRKLILANNPLMSGPAFSDRERVGVPYRIIALGLIDPDPSQPRKEFKDEQLKELSESIQMYGVISPILVRPSSIPGRFLLVSGERRFRASQLAGLPTIPAVIDQTDDTSEAHTLALQLVENLQRSDLEPLERANAIKLLKDAYKLSVREIATKLGISKSAVQRSLDILSLPPDLIAALKDGVPESKVLLLANVDSQGERAKLLSDIGSITRDNLRETVVGGANAKASLSPEDKRLVEEVQRSLGLKVRLARSRGLPSRGRISIDFYSDEDLQEIFKRFIP